MKAREPLGMGNEPLVAGIDIGTSGVRCIVFDRRGAAKTSAYREYPTIVERSDWAELDPEVVVGATVAVVGEAVEAAAVQWPSARVEAVGLSSALFSVMALDRDGRPLTRVLPWMDNRAAGESDRLVDEGLGHELYGKTGCRVHPMYPLSKVLWLQGHEPEVWQAADKFVSIKEYVIWRLFGTYVVDYSVA